MECPPPKKNMLLTSLLPQTLGRERAPVLCRLAKDLRGCYEGQGKLTDVNLEEGERTVLNADKRPQGFPRLNPHRQGRCRSHPHTEGLPCWMAKFSMSLPQI